MLLRNDGTTLYLTKDLALAKQKFEQYHVDRSVYVVDVRQSLHFQQAFKILELMGFPQAPKCYHLAYGFVTLPEGAMSALPRATSVNAVSSTTHSAVNWSAGWPRVSAWASRRGPLPGWTARAAASTA